MAATVPAPIRVTQISRRTPCVRIAASSACVPRENRRRVARSRRAPTVQTTRRLPGDGAIDVVRVLRVADDDRTPVDRLSEIPLALRASTVSVWPAVIRRRDHRRGRCRACRR